MRRTPTECRISVKISATLRLAMTASRNDQSRLCLDLRSSFFVRSGWKSELSGTTVMLDNRNVLQLENRRGVRPNALAERRVVNQRYAIGWNDRLQLRKPSGITQLVWKALFQDAECDEGRCRCAWGGAQKGNKGAVCRGHQFGTELEQPAALGVRLDDLDALPCDLQPPIIFPCVGIVLPQRGKSMLR